MSTVFLGDGTLGEGVTYESLNIASLWQLPVLFVVENNHYAQSTPIELELAGSIAARGAAFGVETAELDTTDVEVIHEAAGRAVARIRETGAPFFLVLNTYRFSPHSKSDDQRDPAEIEERRTRDPLLVAGARLADDERTAIEARCEERLAETVEAADAAPAAAPGGRVSTTRAAEARRPGAERGAARDLRRARRRRPLRRGRPRPVRRRVQGDAGAERRVSRTACSRRRSARRRSSASPPGWRCAGSARSSRSCSATSSRSASTRSSTGSRSSARCTTTR